ncbi:MAG: hypothetical protein U0Q16_23690 [Bryobacteraceae bacterium]
MAKLPIEFAAPVTGPPRIEALSDNGSQTFLLLLLFALLVSLALTGLGFDTGDMAVSVSQAFNNMGSGPEGGPGLVRF